MSFHKQRRKGFFLPGFRGRLSGRTFTCCVLTKTLFFPTSKASDLIFNWNMKKQVKEGFFPSFHFPPLTDINGVYGEMPLTAITASPPGSPRREAGVWTETKPGCFCIPLASLIACPGAHCPPSPWFIAGKGHLTWLPLPYWCPLWQWLAVFS